MGVKHFGRIKVVGEKTDEDGNYTLDLEVDDAFTKHFMEMMDLDEWDEEVFDKWFNEALLKYLEDKEEDNDPSGV